MRYDGKITWAIEMEGELRHFRSKSVIKRKLMRGHDPLKLVVRELCLVHNH